MLYIKKNLPEYLYFDMRMLKKPLIVGIRIVDAGDGTAYGYYRERRVPRLTLSEGKTHFISLVNHVF